jgi:hypothetical protein
MTEKERTTAVVNKLIYAAALTLTCALALVGCNKGHNANAPARPLSEFERDLVTVKNGGFGHIYVFARKDGQALQADDKSYLKAHPPDDVNSMWLLSDQERRVILGTNTDFTPENLGALTKRFNVEDYTHWSPPR